MTEWLNGNGVNVNANKTRRKRENSFFSPLLFFACKRNTVVCSSTTNCIVVYYLPYFDFSIVQFCIIFTHCTTFWKWRNANWISSQVWSGDGHWPQRGRTDPRAVTFIPIQFVRKRRKSFLDSRECSPVNGIWPCWRHAVTNVTITYMRRLQTESARTKCQSQNQRRSRVLICASMQLSPVAVSSVLFQHLNAARELWTIFFFILDFFMKCATAHRLVSIDSEQNFIFVAGFLCTFMDQQRGRRYEINSRVKRGGSRSNDSNNGNAPGKWIAAKQFDQHRQQYPHRDDRVGRRVTIGAYCARAHKRTKRMNQTIYDVLWVAAVFRFLYLFIILMRWYKSYYLIFKWLYHGGWPIQQIRL